MIPTIKTLANVARIVVPVVTIISSKIQKAQEEKVQEEKANVEPEPTKSRKTETFTAEVKQSTKHCINCNEELELCAMFCSECGVKQYSANVPNSALPTENNNIYDKFIQAAKQSKIDSEGYILMSEFSPTCRGLGIEWDRDNGFKKFLENYKDFIEFKPNVPFNKAAVRIKPKTSEKPKPEFLEQKLKEPYNNPQTPEKFNFLEQKIKEADKIYIDTCSLMETPIEKFFEKANPILKKYNKKMIVLSVVVMELKKIVNSEKYELEKRIKAKNALKELNPINEIEFSNEEYDYEKADPVFKIIFEINRIKYKMLLITQDSPLSNEILYAGKSKSAPGEKCVVCRINDDGYLCDAANI